MKIPIAAAALSLLPVISHATWYQPNDSCISMEAWVNYHKVDIRGTPHTPDELISLTNVTLAELHQPNRFTDITLQFFPPGGHLLDLDVRVITSNKPGTHPVIWIRGEQFCQKILSNVAAHKGAYPNAR